MSSKMLTFAHIKLLNEGNMKIMCNIITGAIRDLARQIGRSESYTCNLVSTWQTQNNSASYPTAAQLNEILKSNKEQAWEIYLAVPNYEVREYNPNVVPIEHVNGQIYLMRLPKDKPMEHFYKMYKHLPELRELAVTPEEAYRFILWREMAFMQYGLSKKPENRPVAEGEAIKKAKEWRKRHPVSVQVAPASVVQTYNGNWTRQAVANDLSTLYIFTDNTDRDSGSGIIPADSWYSKKYGTGHHFPTMTAAVIRGLDNARPISTQRWYHQGAKGPTGRWNDADFDEFKKVIDDEFDEILKEWNTGKYKTIMLPQGDGLFNTRISQITMVRTPKLYQYLQDKYQTLLNTVNRSSQEQQPSDINTISDKSADFGVEIIPGGSAALKSNYESWQQQHPDGIVAYRVNFRYYNSPEEANAGRIGNPFSENSKDKSTVQQFYDWLITGENFGNIKATEEYRQAIIQRILNTPENAPILYYTELNRPSHATVLGYLVNNKQLLQQPTQQSLPKLSFEQALNRVRDWYRWQREHITFDEASHTYYIDGKAADYSVTQYGESIYGAPNIQGDYSFTQAIGRSVDALTRDFFLRDEDPTQKEYPNLSRQRKRAILADLERLKAHLDKEFNGKYQVITAEFPIAARIATKDGDKTIAGTMDMLILDGEGNLHIFDMKAKNHPINQKYNGKEVNDRRNYTFQLNSYRQILEAIFPEFKGKIKDLRLIWFDQSYPRQGKEATFVTADDGTVTVSDREVQNQPLQDYYKWLTPALKANVQESLIPLDASQSPLEGVRPIQENWSPQKQQQQTEQRIAKSFSVEEAAEVKPQPQVVTQEDTNNVYKVPEIGTDVLRVDPNNPVARLARDFTAMERHDRVVMLARNFSNIVDRAVEEKIQENADAITAEMGKDEPDRAELARLYERALLLNDSVKGRRAIMQDKTVQQIFKEMREEIESYMEMTPKELDEDYGEGQGEYMLQAYQKVLDNWDALLDEACIIIEGTENVRVTTNRHAYNTGTSTETVTGGTIADSSQDEDTNESEFSDDEDGNRVDSNEGWSFKVRFVDPRTSLSRGVKRVLSGIKKIGINGEPEVDDIGNIKYVDQELVHSALINHLSGMIDADDFSVKKDDGTYDFPALEKVAEIYPWANQVINALKAEPSLISSFYADFRKDFIPYWIQYFDEYKGKWVTHQVNKPVALDSTLSRITRDYEQGSVWDENSIYDGGRKLNTANAELGVNLTNEILSLLREFDEDDYEELTEKVAKGLKMVGLNANAHVISNLLKSENGIVNLEKVVNAMKNIFSGIEGMPENAHLIEAFSDDYNTIAQEVGLVSELDNIQSFRNGDKTYYSYSAPNYLDTMFKIFKSDERRDAYLQEQFGKYSWFKKNGQWRSEWLRLIESDEDVRDQMMLKELNNIDGIEYTNWEPLQIKAAFVREYFSVGYNKGSKKQFAWYNMPIFSDSPVTKFIKFLRYTGDFKGQLTPLFNKVVKQELSRIRLVQDRKKAGVTPIANFDKNGDKFHFFPELNSYHDGHFLEEAMALTEAKDLDGLNKLINDAVTEIMNQNFANFLNSNFSESSYKALRESLLTDGAITSETQFENALEEYFWNQAYATSQIIQLTTTDLAYYKDGTDFQKRYKEVYAAGTKLNTNSQYGREIERTIYLADQIITSAAYQDIRRSLNRAVQLGHIQPFDRDNILNKFKDINVADAQAYRSLSSMRAVLDMMGAWTPEMQQAMDRFDNGEWDMADFNIVWQTIKPFVFTQIEKPDGLGGSIKVPHQNKNSEFLLLSMYQMVAGSMNRSPKLKALNRFMEDKEIDVIQFESAVKVGKQGTIDISYSEPKLQVWKMNHEKEWKEIEKAAKTSGSDYSVFKAGNDYLLDHDMISQEEYNDRFEAIEPTEQEVYDLLESMSMQNGEFKPEVVHEIPYSDYVIQQPTPEHLFDHVAVFGSQFRNLIISDMPDDPDFRVKVNGKSLTKQQVLDLYQANIVENLLEDWEKVKGKFADIRSLQKAMLDAVKGNPKYGRDMLDALQIVEIVNPRDSTKTIEVFNIPLDNPSTTSKIQELITSMFKNAITKQSIKGASCILVSDFGLTKELNILHGEDGSIQGIECYLPAYSKQFYEPFAVTKVDDAGNEYQELDVTKMPMELRRIIGYRIPTEDKYSMAPLIIKGFLPQQNGSSIMLPADITQIAGSDFDVDKMFLMIPEFRRRDKYAIKAAWDAFYQEHPEITSQIEAAQWTAFVNSYNELLKKNPKEAEEIDVEDEEFKDWFVRESKLKNYEWVEGVQDAFAKWFKTNKQRFFQGTEITKVEYDESKSPQEQSRAARNNMIIDVAWGILTNPDTAEKIHNPGSFDKTKIAARIATIISDPALLDNFAGEHGLMHQIADNDYEYNPEEVAQLLLEISKEGRLDELDQFIKKYKVERSQLTVDTFIYNHRQNMTGSMLIGMYANNTTMQAKFQVTGLAIKDDYVFTINGRTVQSLHDIMSPNGDRISKNCANFSAASVDNVKDPVLADLMQNTQTANIAGFMLRAGMSVEEIGLLFSQPLVRRCITKTGGLKKLGSYVRSMIRMLKENGGGVDDKIQLHDFTSEELILNAINEIRISEMTQEELNNHLASQIQAGLLMVHISQIAQDLSDLTQIARADSPNGAISTSIAGAKNQTRKVDLYARRAKTKRFTLTGLGDIMQNKYVTANMSREQMREKFLKSKMPMLQTFYSLGIELGSQVMGQYFSQTTAYSDALVEQLYDNSPIGIISDDTLNSFYSELVEFALSRTKMLGDDDNATFDEKRDYYLYDFPKEYLGVLATNPDIANMSIFRKMQVKDGNIVMGRSGRLTPMMRETLMRDFDMLLYMDNPAAQKLAVDLFMYSYYKDGFKFGPNSFGTFFSSNFISSFPKFVGALRELRFGMQSGTYFDNFLPQFYANHWQELVPQIDEKADVVEIDNAQQIAVNAKSVLNRNLLGLNETKSYPMIAYSKELRGPDGKPMVVTHLYSLSLDGSDRAIYTLAVEISDSQKGKRGVKYNANMTTQEMAGIETDKARIEANATLNPSSNPKSLYSSSARRSSDDDFGGFTGGMDMDSVLTGMEEQYSEAGGEAQLDNKLC